MAEGWREVDPEIDTPAGEPANWLTPDDYLVNNLVVRNKYDAADGGEVDRASFKPDVVHKRWGQTFASGSSPGANSMAQRQVVVRPLRPLCVNYRRQLFNIDGKDPHEQGGKHQFQNCAARRSNGGALLSLNGQAIYACDYRNPPDLPSTERFLDGFDKKRLREKKHLKLVPVFGMSGEEIDLEDKAIS